MKPAPKIKLFTKYYCGWCHEVLDYLKKLGWEFEELEVARDDKNFAQLQKLSGQTKTPTALIDGKMLVDFGVEELEEFLGKEGYLE
jgi:glutaredoxin